MSLPEYLDAITVTSPAYLSNTSPLPINIKKYPTKTGSSYKYLDSEYVTTEMNRVFRFCILNVDCSKHVIEKVPFDKPVNNVIGRVNVSVTCVIQWKSIFVSWWSRENSVTGTSHGYALYKYETEDIQIGRLINTLETKAIKRALKNIGPSFRVPSVNSPVQPLSRDTVETTSREIFNRHNINLGNWEHVVGTLGPQQPQHEQYQPPRPQPSAFNIPIPPQRQYQQQQRPIPQPQPRQQQQTPGQQYQQSVSITSRPQPQLSAYIAPTPQPQPAVSSTPKQQPQPSSFNTPRQQPQPRPSQQEQEPQPRQQEQEQEPRPRQQEQEPQQEPRPRQQEQEPRPQSHQQEPSQQEQLDEEEQQSGVDGIQYDLIDNTDKKGSRMSTSSSQSSMNNFFRQQKIQRETLQQQRQREARELIQKRKDEERTANYLKSSQYQIDLARIQSIQAIRKDNKLKELTYRTDPEYVQLYKESISFYNGLQSDVGSRTNELYEYACLWYTQKIKTNEKGNMDDDEYKLIQWWKAYEEGKMDIQTIIDKKLKSDVISMFLLWMHREKMSHEVGWSILRHTESYIHTKRQELQKIWNLPKFKPEILLSLESRHLYSTCELCLIPTIYSKDGLDVLFYDAGYRTKMLQNENVYKKFLVEFDKVDKNVDCLGY